MIPLVMIPGMMCDARLFAPQIGVLGRRVVVHGTCTEADTVQALAALVLAVTPPRFALLGLSMGGIVAMEMLRQAANRIERIALLDTNPLAETPKVAARRLRQIDRAMNGQLASVMRDEMKPNYLADGPGKAAILDLCMDMALALGPQVFVRQSNALATRPDQQTTLAAFKGPALVLMGAEDRLCPRERHDLMHDLMPQSRLVIIDGAGHLPTLEQPAQTTTAILDWLSV